ncbi:MAG: hypothetical protein U9N85_11580 [Bacteroidota bacterium]|nr:hypothetical protein [Bacteroidota bacterium]
MRRKIFFIIWLFSVITLSAQEKPEDEYKYFQSENGKLYWNMKLPVYLSISSSPEGNQQPLLYKNKQQPFFFGTEGLNYIKTPWAVDKQTKQTVYPKQTVNFLVYVDGSPPSVRYNFQSDKKYVSGQTIYFGKNTQFSLSASDKISGSKAIYLTKDQSPFSAYSQTLELTQSGPVSLAYYAVDSVGNSSPLKKHDIIIDITAPVTQLVTSNADLDSIRVLSGESEIKLQAEDDLSGVSKTYYQFEGQPLKQYYGQIPISSLKTGGYKFSYYSTDYVANKEDKKTYSFYLDKAPPMIAPRIIGDVYEVKGKTFFSGRTQMKLVGVDNKAGIQALNYSIDGGEFITYEQAFYLPTTKGKHLIRYYGIDSTGNDSRGSKDPSRYTYKLENFYMDLTGPEISHKISGDKFQPDTVLFISNRTKIALKSNDSESGTKSSAFSIDGERKENDYTTPFNLEGLSHGHHFIEYYSYDNVNNRNVGGFDFFLDRKGPEISFSFGSSQLGTREGLSVYSSYVAVFITATDENTEIESLSFSINNQAEKPYPGIIRGFKKGQKNVVTAKVVDLLGNVSEETIEFYTD